VEGSGEWGDGAWIKLFECGHCAQRGERMGIKLPVQIFLIHRLSRYICRLTDKHTRLRHVSPAACICSSVLATEEYSTVIFYGTEE
jgi:hypothetical protein